MGKEPKYRHPNQIEKSMGGSATAADWLVPQSTVYYNYAGDAIGKFDNTVSSSYTLTSALTQ